MNALSKINGRFSRESLVQFRAPIAWNTSPDREFELALSELYSEAIGRLDAYEDATGEAAGVVEIFQGSVMGVL